MTDMNLPQVAGVGSLRDALTSHVKTNITQGGGEQFLGYNSYSGKWTFGKDNEVIEPEDRLRIVPEGLRHGWHLWVDKKVMEVMSSVFKPMPEEPAAVQDSKGKLQQASEARGMMAVLVLEDEDDIQVSWEHSTDGCRRAIDGVLSELMLRAQTEAEYLYPVVSLTSGTPYENSYKPGEMITPPKIDIVGWCNQDGEEAPDAPKKVAAPKAEAEPAAEEEDAEEPAAEENAPVRRRRQRTAA